MKQPLQTRRAQIKNQVVPELRSSLSQKFNQLIQSALISGAEERMRTAAQRLTLLQPDNPEAQTLIEGRTE